jgi:Phosphorylase superfamily
MADRQTEGVLVLSWFHEQQGQDPDTGERFFHDPMWTALREELSTGQSRGYSRGLDSVLPALQVRQLVLSERDAYFRIQPRVVNGNWRWGAFQSALDDKAKVFRSDRRVGTDGPTLPVLPMLDRILAEERPSLVISAGIGGGVHPDQQVGDVVVSGKGRFSLRGELALNENNERTFGTGAAIPAGDWAADLLFDELREPALLGASPSFREPAGGWPQPAPHRPTVRVERDRPVVTRPDVQTDTFVPAVTDAQRGNPFLGETSAAVDLDTAPVAKACQDANVPFVAVIGLGVPALEPMAEDFDSSLRDAWAEAFLTTYSVAAAGNAARTVRRLCELAIG